MQRAVALCVAHGAAVGAHPSYPDREGFGRRPMTLAPDALRRIVGEQCARLAAIAREAGVAIGFMKPHGALYHQALADEATAEAIVVAAQVALGARVTVVGAGALARAAARASMPFAREGFADRASRADGTLVPRGEPGAMLLDPAAAAARALALAGGGDIETICVHGDTPGAVAVARAVRAALDSLRGAER
jgi:UPF0271 protein